MHRNFFPPVLSEHSAYRKPVIFSTKCTVWTLPDWYFIYALFHTLDWNYCTTIFHWQIKLYLMCVRLFTVYDSTSTRTLLAHRQPLVLVYAVKVYKCLKDKDSNTKKNENFVFWWQELFLSINMLTLLLIKMQPISQLFGFNVFTSNLSLWKDIN